MLVKSRRGFGSRDIYRCRTPEELEFFLTYTGVPSMVQEVCAGEEFSTDVMCDLDGRCIAAIPRSMIESKGGESIKGRSLDDEGLREFAVRVAETLPIKGPANVQCFRTGPDRYEVTDVNPRFGGAFPLPLAAGGGYPALVLALARGERPERRLGTYRAGVVMTRYFSHVALVESGDGYEPLELAPPPQRLDRASPTDGLLAAARIARQSAHDRLDRPRRGLHRLHPVRPLARRHRRRGGGPALLG